MIIPIIILVKLFGRTLLLMEELKLNSVHDRSARRHLQMIAAFYTQILQFKDCYITQTSIKIGRVNTFLNLIRELPICTRD